MPAAGLAPTELPRLGGTLRVDVERVPDRLAVMLIGFSNTNSAFGPLPVSLAPAGMPGCFARHSSEISQPVVCLGNRGVHWLPIPWNTRFLGVEFFEQALVLDTRAGNAAGAVMSEAARVVVGLANRPNGAPVADMVAIPPGQFSMGSSSGTSNELPVRQVTISYPFWMGRYEVTQTAYRTVMGQNPSFFAGDNRPVERVTWYDALTYCARLTRQEAAAGRLPSGYQYRLPTEAEWEYCCRAGTTTEWSFGATFDCRAMNYNNCVGSTTVVGAYPRNGFGLADMHGNVYEWCLDAWDTLSGYDANATQSPYATGGPRRVFRGGSWAEQGFNCRSAKRDGDGPDARTNFIGFRIVLAPIPVPSNAHPIANMVLVPAGSFQMGSTTGAANERPVHEALITRPMWVGKSEVTQAEYLHVMNVNPAHWPNPTLPVDTVSWNDAMAYCAALTHREALARRVPAGYEYRLPTEAEWEYLCRAGTTTDFHVGATLQCSQANFDMCRGNTTVAGTYVANAWGLHDLHGNLWEWCLDAWDLSNNYPTALVRDHFVTTGTSRVQRGGSWFNPADGCRSAYRGSALATYASSHTGFRVVLAPRLP